MLNAKISKLCCTNAAKASAFARLSFIWLLYAERSYSFPDSHTIAIEKQSGNDLRTNPVLNAPVEAGLVYTARVGAVFASALVQDYTLLWPFGFGGDMWMLVFMVVFLMWRCSKGAMGRAARTERQGPAPLGIILSWRGGFQSFKVGNVLALGAQAYTRLRMPTLHCCCFAG